MKHIRILPLLIPFLVFILFEAFLFYPKNIYVSIVFSNLLVFFAVSRFIKESSGRESLWNFLSLPVFFLTGLGAYSVLIGSRPLAHILFIFNSVFLYLYLRSIYYYLAQGMRGDNLNLGNIFSYGNFFVFFFVSSVIYGLASFLNVAIWPMMVFFVFTSAAAISGVMRANGIKPRENVIYILIISLVLVELGWSVSFLPLNFNIAGLILAVCYYMLAGFSRHHLLGSLDKRMARLYLFSGFGSIAILLLTSRWM